VGTILKLGFGYLGNYYVSVRTGGMITEAGEKVELFSNMLVHRLAVR